jgi:hypothetical protein
MLGLSADPHDLHRYLPNGEFTYGLGYIVGPDNRQAVARADLPSKATRRPIPAVPSLDPRFQAAMCSVIWQRETLREAGQPGTSYLAWACWNRPTCPDGPAQTRSCRYRRASWTGRHHRPGRDLAVRRLGWGKPFSIRSLSDALTAAGSVVKTGQVCA